MTQVAESAADSDCAPRDASTNASTVVAGLAATVREALAAGPRTLPPRLRADIARLLSEGG
jgi:hypothetical protein